MFTNIDKDNSGKIDYSEFVSASINKKMVLQKNKLKSVFTLFDKDGSGNLSIDELKSFFTMGNNSDEMWRKVVEEYDDNGDGEISYEEFLKIIDIILS